MFVTLIAHTTHEVHRRSSLTVIRPGGILVSVVSEPMPDPDRLNNIRSVFFLVEVTTKRLDKITDLFNRGRLSPRVGTILPLEQVRTAHRMLAGAPHQPGKIVLKMTDHF
ncbi:MAG: zinc-binding dehydrogenase [Acidobacteria bacterium]|nr:zinc-binding dehydrogenase [Acidobacteriota bacterium]